MKRDMDLIRELMLKLEEYPKELEDVVHIDGSTPEIHVAGYNAGQITYHLALIYEAGLVDSNGAEARTGIYFYRLSWNGHEFLDTVRDNEVWRRVKAGAAQAGAASVSLLVGLGKAYAKQVIKERLGIDLG
jgi:DNA-binding transcriptional ArsR family regulator